VKDMESIALGQIVHSKAGRDKGKYFIVIEIVDKDYVMLVDGDLRKIANPKRKKLKHLVFHEWVAEDIVKDVKEKNMIVDAQIRKSLQSINLVMK
jgi:large subunit ribosomal protein L14e